MSEHAKLVTAVEKPIGIPVESKLLWKDLDQTIPSSWTLSFFWFLSFFPLISPPSAYHVKMRQFINKERGKDALDAEFNAEKILALIAIFNETPDYQSEKTTVLQSLSSKQMNKMGFQLFHQLLQTFSQEKNNHYLTDILAKFSFDKFSCFFITLEAKLIELVARQKKHDPVRVKPSLMTTSLEADIQWCGHLRTKFSLEDRKKIIKLCHELLDLHCKPLVRQLLSKDEVFQHLQAIQEPDLYSKLYKEEILATATERFRFVFENKEVLKTLLKTLSLDEKYLLFRQILANPHADERLLIMNNFFLCIPTEEHASLLNYLVLDACENLPLENHLHTLLQGKVLSLHIAPFSVFVAEFHFGHAALDGALKNAFNDIDQLCVEIETSALLFSNQINHYSLERLIQTLQNTINDEIGTLCGNNKKVNALNDDKTLMTRCVSSYADLINHRWLNRERTAPDELRYIINHLPTSPLFPKLFPQLRTMLEKLHRLYSIRESENFRIDPQFNSVDVKTTASHPETASSSQYRTRVPS